MVKINPEDNIRIVFQTYDDKVKFLAFSNILGVLTGVENIMDLSAQHEDVEKFHLSFIKKSLGVKKSCSSDCARFEFGTYPQVTTYVPKAIKFYLGMKSCKFNKLIKTSLETSMQNQGDWAQGINYCLKILGLESVIKIQENPAPDKFKDMAKQISKNMYLNYLHYKNSRNFRFLREELGEKYALRNYVTTIVNPSHRSTLAMLRTNSHCLLEESQTYLNCSPLCPYCTMKAIETPFHFMLECTNIDLKLLRQPIIDTLGITVDNNMTIYKNIMRAKIQTKDSTQVYKNIHNMYSKRKHNELTKVD